MKKFIVFLALLLSINFLQAQKTKAYRLLSPDGKFQISVVTGETISWSVQKEAQSIIAPSSVTITLSNGEVLGKDPKVSSVKKSAVNETINTVVYKKIRLKIIVTSLRLPVREAMELFSVLMTMELLTVFLHNGKKNYKYNQSRTHLILIKIIQLLFRIQVICGKGKDTPVRLRNFIQKQNCQLLIRIHLVTCLY